MRIVEVDWLDHCEDGPTWVPYDDAMDAKLARCHTVGYLVHEDDERIVVCSSWVDDDDETVSRPFVIARACVTRFEVIRE